MIFPLTVAYHFVTEILFEVIKYPFLPTVILLGILRYNSNMKSESVRKERASPLFCKLAAFHSK